jgi:hypothetical protein
MTWRGNISSTNTRDSSGGHSRGRRYGRVNNRGRDGRGGERGNGRGIGRGSESYRNKSNSTGYYSPADWSKLSFEERNKICKDRNKKGKPGGTNKRTIGDISVEQVTAIIGAIQQHNAAADTAESSAPKTSNNQAGNAFGGKEGAKKWHAGGE